MTGEIINGDLSVANDVAVGGSVNINSDLTIGHNVKVEGWLDAPHIKGSLKGIYQSRTALERQYQKPKPGEWAIVLVDDTTHIYGYGESGWADYGEHGIRVETSGELEDQLYDHITRVESKNVRDISVKPVTEGVHITLTLNDGTQKDAVLPQATCEGEGWKAGIITGADLYNIGVANTTANDAKSLAQSASATAQTATANASAAQGDASAARTLAQSASATAEAASDNAAQAMVDAGGAVVNAAAAKQTAQEAKDDAAAALAEMVLPIAGIAPSRYGGQLIGSKVEGKIFCRDERTFYDSVDAGADVIAVYGEVLAKAAPGVDVELQGRNLLLHTNHYTAAIWDNPISHDHRLFTMRMGSHASAEVVEIEQRDVPIADLGVPGVDSGIATKFSPRRAGSEFGTTIEDEGIGIDREATDDRKPWQVILYPIRTDVLKPNTQYTVSWKTTSFGQKMSAVLGTPSQSVTLTDRVVCDCHQIADSGGARTHTATLTTKSASDLAAAGNQQMYLLLLIESIEGVNPKWYAFALFDLKMEEGAVATAWTPAPEDSYPGGMSITPTTDPLYTQVYNHQRTANPMRVYRLGGKIYHFDLASGRLLRYLDESDLESIHP